MEQQQNNNNSQGASQQSQPKPQQKRYQTQQQEQEFLPLVFNEEIEKRVLTAILCNNNCYYAAANLLKYDTFRNGKNARLYKIIQEGIANSKVVDTMYCAMYVMEHPDKNGYSMNDIMAEFSGYVSDSTFSQDIETLRQLAKRRKIWKLSAKLNNICKDMSYTVDMAYKDINAVLDDDDTSTDGVISMKQANAELKKRITANANGTSDTALYTGFAALDENGGFQLIDFNVIAADSSMGKTSLAMNIAENVASKGKPVMIYSMEMQSWQLSARINAHTADTPASIIQYQKLAESQAHGVENAMSTTDDLPIYFDDKSTSSAEAIMASIRLNARKLGIKLFIIDYLQILSAVGSVKNQESFLGEVSRKLKNLAKELNVNITVLSQLARNPQDPRPTLARVRASGQIVEAADTVLLIWRPSAYGKTAYKDSKAPVFNTAEIIIAKGRNTGTGSFVVHFNPKTTYFYDATPEERQEWSMNSFTSKKNNGGQTSKKEDMDASNFDNSDPFAPPPPSTPNKKEVKQSELPFM